MLVVNAYEFKHHLSRLHERASLGEEVVAEAGRPMTRVTPIRHPYAEGKPGSGKAKIT